MSRQHRHKVACLDRRGRPVEVQPRDTNPGLAAAMTVSAVLPAKRASTGTSIGAALRPPAMR
jgi:hypothetical protein